MITGRGSFVGDLIEDDTLHAWFVRSPMACGPINAVETELAAMEPGVAAVFTSADLDLRDLPPPPVGQSAIVGMDRPMMASDTVAHVGQAVAVVIAQSAPQAEDAAALVMVDIDMGDPVLTVDEAAEDRALVHPHTGTNVVFHETLEAGPQPLGEELIEITVEVEHPRLAPSPVEALAALAVPRGPLLHMHAGVQAPHQLQRELAYVLDIDPAEVRVTVPDVGGAFGMKRFQPEYAVIAAAARRLGRPVAWVQPRRDLFTAGPHGRGQYHEVSLRATDEGRIGSAKFDLVTDVGAYPHAGAQIGTFSRLVATGLYDIPHVQFDLQAIVTNLPPTAPYRGAGRPEAALAIERAMDALAARLGIDPAELRRRNLIRSLPHQTPTGAQHDSGDYAAALDRALELSGYSEVREEQAERLRGGSDPLGVGIGAYIERAGGRPDSWEYGSVAIDEHGVVTARTGSTSAGQGHATTWRRVVAEAFDVDPVSVVLHAGDTEEVPESVGSFASRSTQIGAAALWRCAERVRRLACEIAADMLEAAPEDLQVSKGRIVVAGVPGQGVTLAEAAEMAKRRGAHLSSSEKYSPGAQTFPYGVHVAVVEVDLDTGAVHPIRVVAVDDVGSRLDEALVVGQVHGSVMQGLGAALYESMRYDTGGQPLTTTFMDYLVPFATLDTPLDVDHLSHGAPSNPLGAKGAGEGGCIGTPPAILNATIDALRPHGVTNLQIPLTADKVWHALQSVAR